jgi:hypothetical protein
LQYFEQVRTVTQSAPDRLELIAAPPPNAVTGPARRLELYRVRFQSPGPAKALQLDLAYTLGRTLQR